VGVQSHDRNTYARASSVRMLVFECWLSKGWWDRWGKQVDKNPHHTKLIASHMPLTHNTATILFVHQLTFSSTSAVSWPTKANAHWHLWHLWPLAPVMEVDARPEHRWFPAVGKFTFFLLVHSSTYVPLGMEFAIFPPLVFVNGGNGPNGGIIVNRRWVDKQGNLSSWKVVICAN